VAPRRNELVLVVEDDSATRELYRAALRAAGYGVVAVEDGADALRFVEQQHPDVVVLDLDLPRVGGRDVLLELRAHPATRSIPVIVATGTSLRDFELSEDVLLLAKPFQAETLVWQIDRAVLRSRRRLGPAPT
jgi:two-component system phosphate regulon response regulator PhoB